jgi:hypothetical protein
MCDYLSHIDTNLRDGNVRATMSLLRGDNMSFFSMHLQYMESFHFSRPAYNINMSHVSGLRAELSTYNTSPLSLSLHEGTCVGAG